MMKRPVMNPSFMDEADATPSTPVGQRLKQVMRLFLKAARILLTPVFKRKAKLQVDIGTPFSRFMRGLLYRLMFLPAVMAILVLALVVTATHPRPAAVVNDPSSQGVYYDPVELLSLDNTKLEGWLIPVVDARRVLVEKEELLHKRHPAVVLVHDFGTSRQQMLPLIAPLHEAGYVLLAVNLRGHGPSAGTGATFGLNEAQDVRAAVELLRRRSFVDPDAIGVLGIGTGATAALLAAKQDSRLGVLVLDHPVRQFEDLLVDRIGPRQQWLSCLRPICKWVFEIGYQVDAAEVNINQFTDLMRARHTLMLDESGELASSIKPVRCRQIVDFLHKHLVSAPRAVTRLMQKDSVGAVELQEDASEPMWKPGESWPPQQSATDLLKRNRGTGW